MGDNSRCNIMPQRAIFDIGNRYSGEVPQKPVMTIGRAALPRFILLYAALFGAFGFSSPFLPAFLASRGLQPEALGLVLGAGTALRLISGLIAGRVADARNAFRAELAIFAVLAAIAALIYLPAHEPWQLAAISLLQAAALAPLVPLADALALAAASGTNGRCGFEYGWVRGAGSAAFIAGMLLAGQAVAGYGLVATIWLGAACLIAASFCAPLVPALRADASAPAQPQKIFGRDSLVLLRQRSFLLVVLVAALVLGSHAMHDSFAVIRWGEAGIGAPTVSVLWSESVAAEVVVFFLIGPWLLKKLNPTGAMTAAALAGALRWSVMAQTTQAPILALLEPLHGFTFALLHLACMRLIAQIVPSGMAGTAQALYGLVGVGGATALLTICSGWLYARFGAGGFWAMALLCLAALPAIWMLQRSLSAAAISR
jgi:MFS transporter, PPP family, 3-phenylpropionic acid transporter